MKKLALSFFGDDVPELVSTKFDHPLVGRTLHSIRGKTMGAFGGSGTFQWTRGVQGLVLLLLVSKNEEYLQKRSKRTSPILQGMRNSSALSLDNAIEKKSLWLMDMFGTDRNGSLLARRLVLRTNSGLRLPGPVALRLNYKFLEPRDIEIRCNGKILTTGPDIERMASAIQSMLPTRCEVLFEDIGISEERVAA